MQNYLFYCFWGQIFLNPSLFCKMVAHPTKRCIWHRNFSVTLFLNNFFTLPLGCIFQTKKFKYPFFFISGCSTCQTVHSDTEIDVLRIIFGYENFFSGGDFENYLSALFITLLLLRCIFQATKLKSFSILRFHYAG